MTTPISRRSVARGAAWSIPAVAVAGAAPAMAGSSQCTTKVRGGFGTTYSFGDIRTSIFSSSTTNQKLTFGGVGYVDGLPSGATVTDMVFDFWFEKRPDGQTGPGAPVFIQSSPTRGQSYSYTPTTSSGFSQTVTNTSGSGGTRQVYPNGATYTSWNARMTWSSAQDGLNLYRTGADGCRNFQTGESGKFTVYYNGVPALTSSDVNAGKETVQTFVTVSATVKLADGSTLPLSKSYQTVLK